jgi:hypothetical protein
MAREQNGSNKLIIPRIWIVFFTLAKRSIVYEAFLFGTMKVENFYDVFSNLGLTFCCNQMGFDL